MARGCFNQVVAHSRTTVCNREKKCEEGDLNACQDFLTLVVHCYVFLCCDGYTKDGKFE